MKLIVFHKIGKSEAITIIKNKIYEFLTLGDEDIKNLIQNWNQDTLEFNFSSKGFSFSGELTIFDDSMSITLNLPFSLRLYEPKLRTKLDEKLSFILSQT